MNQRYQWTDVFQYLSAESTKMEPTLRSIQDLKQEAEDIGLQGKDIAEYIKDNKHWIERRGQLGEIPRKVRVPDGRITSRR